MNNGVALNGSDYTTRQDTPKAAGKTDNPSDATGWMPATLQNCGTDAQDKKVLVMFIEVSSVVTSTKMVHLELIHDGSTLRIASPPGHFMTNMGRVEKLLGCAHDIHPQDATIYCRLLDEAMVAKYGESTVLEVAYIPLVAKCSTFKRAKVKLLGGNNHTDAKTLMIIFRIAADVKETMFDDDSDSILNYSAVAVNTLAP